MAFQLLSVIAIVFATGGSLAIAVGNRILAHLEEMFDKADTNADGEVPKKEIKLANHRVIRKGDWKLHLFLEEWVLDGGQTGLANNHAVELYNLKVDIGEHLNLATENIAKRDELLADLLA